MSDPGDDNALQFSSEANLVFPVLEEAKSALGFAAVAETALAIHKALESIENTGNVVPKVLRSLAEHAVAFAFVLYRSTVAIQQPGSFFSEQNPTGYVDSAWTQALIQLREAQRLIKAANNWTKVPPYLRTVSKKYLDRKAEVKVSCATIQSLYKRMNPEGSSLSERFRLECARMLVQRHSQHGRSSAHYVVSPDATMLAPSNDYGPANEFISIAPTDDTPTNWHGEDKSAMSPLTTRTSVGSPSPMMNHGRSNGRPPSPKASHHHLAAELNDIGLLSPISLASPSPLRGQEEPYNIDTGPSNGYSPPSGPSTVNQRTNTANSSTDGYRSEQKPREVLARKTQNWEGTQPYHDQPEGRRSVRSNPPSSAQPSVRSNARTSTQSYAAERGLARGSPPRHRHTMSSDPRLEGGVPSSSRNASQSRPRAGTRQSTTVIPNLRDARTVDFRDARITNAFNDNSTTYW